MAWTASGYESKKILPFEVDEHAMQVNHYFKRKATILSPAARLCLILGVLKALVIAGDYMTRTEKSYKLPKTLQIWLHFDLIGIANVTILALSLVVAKGFTQTMQKYCPYALQEIKRAIAPSPHRTPSSSPSAKHKHD